MKFLLAALIDSCGKGGNRLKDFADEIGHDKQQNRDQYQKGHSGAQRAISCDFVTDCRLLSYSKAYSPADSSCQDTIGFIINTDSLQAIMEVLR